MTLCDVIDKRGKLFIPCKTYLLIHEQKTIDFLLDLGNDIEVLKPTSAKTPDIKMNNEFWEIKSPIGKGKNNIRNIIKAAKHQSENIILDMRRSPIEKDIAIVEINREFTHRRRARKLYCIFADETFFIEK
jgi:hypothetical protein